MVNVRPNSVRILLLVLACGFLRVSDQCMGLSKPRLRVSDYFGAPGGVDYLNPNNVGQHCYNYDRHRKEKVGMIYTRRAGFLDIGHVREAADRTRYVINLLQKNLAQSRKSFQFKMIEPSCYYVSITYPDYWNDLDKADRDKIVREVSIQYGQYLGHQSLVWHELLTWFGYASSGLFSEQISSFSWEDPYSDVVGTRLAVKAIRQNPAGDDYDEMITQLLNQKIAELEPEPARVGQEAENKIKGKWYTGSNYFFVEMKKRNFDVGFDDGKITPWLVPGMFPDAKPLLCPVPDPNCLDKYGFKITVRMDPRASEKGKIYKALNLDPKTDLMQLDIHFPKLLEYIKKQAQKEYGKDVDKPTL